MLRPARWFTTRTLYWAIAGLMLGGIVHIVAVLGIPEFAAGTAWKRLRTQTPANAFKLLAAASPELQPIPFMAPDVRYAVCRFDLSSSAPVFVRGKLLDASWSVGLYTPAGDNFYAMTSADLQRGDFDLLVTPPPERSMLQIAQSLFGRITREVRDLKDGPTVVLAPVREGLVVVRAPLMGRAFAREAELALAQSVCGLKTR